jgi:hypothetical protein
MGCSRKQSLLRFVQRTQLFREPEADCRRCFVFKVYSSRIARYPLPFRKTWPHLTWSRCNYELLMYPTPVLLRSLFYVRLDGGVGR